MRVVALLFLVACAGKPEPVKPPPVVAPPQPGTPTAQQVTAHGLAQGVPYRMVILAGPGIADIEWFTVYYGMTARGWTVHVATPDGAETRGRHGIPVPADAAVADVDPKAYDVLFVPGGAPADPASAALIKTFSRDRHLASTRAGAKLVAATGVNAARASNNEHVVVQGNQLSSARPGDLPGLLFALDMYAADILRQAHAKKEKSERGPGDPP